MTEVKINQASNIEPPKQSRPAENFHDEQQKIESKVQELQLLKHEKQISSPRNSQKTGKWEDILGAVKQQGGKKEQNKALDKNDLEEIKKATNQVLEQINIELDFSVDKDLNTVVVKVINKETGKVIRQIPPEEMLKIAKRIEEMTGLLLDRWS